MSFVFSQWFSVGLSIPALFLNFLFIAAGVAVVRRVKAKKTVIIIMSTLAAIFFVACAVTHIDFEMFRIYAVYVAGLSLDAFVGAAIGAATRGCAFSSSAV